MTIIGYKGLDLNMKGLYFKYEMGKNHVYDGELEPGKKGFHFCRELGDVFKWYPFTHLARFFVCEIGGNVIDSDGKSVCSEITIIRELTGTYELYECAVERLGYALAYIDKQDNELCLKAVNAYGLALEFCKYKTEEICLDAVKNDGLALQFVEKQTPAIQLAAITQNPEAKHYVM